MLSLSEGQAKQLKPIACPPRAAVLRHNRPTLIIISLYIPYNSMGGMTQRPWTPTKRRGPIAAEFSGPGPACVSLPSYIGKKTSESNSGRSPSYSFGARHNDKLENIGPGPGQYNVTGLSAKGKDTPPSLSLHGRAKEHKPDNFPAPGSYDPDKAEKVTHDNAPKFTFGLKTNVEKPLDTPAPNAYKPFRRTNSHRYSFGRRTPISKPSETPAPNVYNVPHSEKAPNVYTIPSAVGDKVSPAYTISGRTKEPLDERVKNPAPGQYDNVDPEHYKTHSPAYTISGRINVPKDDTIPGPGVYSPEKVILNNAQAHSFGIRHSPFSEHY
ncbi:hypothetical protein NQ318_012610 [Aromia moschata]|uniref:Outer dense fiber protein 3 n=1 Tax=Aromia moschata TaxID=1265417 RepID=A0AAV8YJ56_9CUCU|nr:hypothetical protein NQ318_012610 [Aromia moschata]